MVAKSPTIGVLALQGGFLEHQEAIIRLGCDAPEIRQPKELDSVDALILPGGESTAISKLLVSSGLFEAISQRLASSTLPIFGTCAGMILSAHEVLDGTPDQLSFGIFKARVRRNGIGRQIASFEASISVNGLDKPFPGVFIRPPVIESMTYGELLSELDGRYILCRNDKHLFATFHPELTGDDRIHKMFIDGISTS